MVLLPQKGLLEWPPFTGRSWSLSKQTQSSEATLLLSVECSFHLLLKVHQTGSTGEIPLQLRNKHRSKERARERERETPISGCWRWKLSREVNHCAAQGCKKWARIFLSLVHYDGFPYSVSQKISSIGDQKENRLLISLYAGGLNYWPTNRYIWLEVHLRRREQVSNTDTTCTHREK